MNYIVHDFGENDATKISCELLVGDFCLITDEGVTIEVVVTKRVFDAENDQWFFYCVPANNTLSELEVETDETNETAEQIKEIEEVIAQETTISREGKHDVEALIYTINKSKDFRNIHTYVSENKSWQYYYSITGYFKDKYFSVTIYSCDDIQTVRVAKTTECTKEITKFLAKFRLIVTEGV